MLKILTEVQIKIDDYILKGFNNVNPYHCLSTLLKIDSIRLSNSGSWPNGNDDMFGPKNMLNDDVDVDVDVDSSCFCLNRLLASKYMFL